MPGATIITRNKDKVLLYLEKMILRSESSLVVLLARQGFDQFSRVVSSASWVFLLKNSRLISLELRVDLKVGFPDGSSSGLG